MESRRIHRICMRYPLSIIGRLTDQSRPDCSSVNMRVICNTKFIRNPSYFTVDVQVNLQVNAVAHTSMQLTTYRMRNSYWFVYVYMCVCVYVFITFNEILKWKYVYVYVSTDCGRGGPTGIWEADAVWFWCCFLSRHFHLMQFRGVISDDWKNVYHFEEKRLVVASSSFAVRDWVKLRNIWSIRSKIKTRIQPERIKENIRLHDNVRLPPRFTYMCGARKFYSNTFRWL